MELKGIQWIIGARPTKMSDVFGGSSSIIDTVIKPFVQTHAKSDSWPNGILLMGKSGSGKTTIAKIIAMSMVCQHLDADGNPCGKCPDCEHIISEKFKRDVTLVTSSTLKADAESANAGLNKLIQDSRARPAWGGKRRVIIFDEVQEILRSRGAINELLKELERKDSSTCWIFTSMDNIKASGSTVETELGNGSGYGSSGQSGFLRRVAPATFKFSPLTVADTMRAIYDFAHKHTYEGKLLWDVLKELSAGTDFMTTGIKTIAEGSVGSIGVAIANLQWCFDSKVFDTPTIEKYVNACPEVKVLEAITSIANNEKSDEAFLQISNINQDNFSTVYQIMMSEIRRAEMVRVFGKVGNVKIKDGKEEFKTVDASTTGPERITFCRADALRRGPNYAKLRDTLIELNQSGFFTVDLFKVKLLSIFN